MIGSRSLLVISALLLPQGCVEPPVPIYVPPETICDPISIDCVQDPLAPNQGAPDASVPQSLGSRCLAAADCKSGYCTDGLCCKREGCPDCQRCGADGECEHRPAGTAPAGQCPGDPLCGAGTCDGKAQCAYKALGTPCKTRCESHILVEFVCGHAHGCAADRVVTCKDYLRCTDDATACQTGCVDHKDCIENSLCDRSAAHGTRKGVCRAPGAIRWVGPGQRFASIEAALQTPDDTAPIIGVRPGLYTDRLTIENRAVSIIGVGTASDPVQLKPSSQGPVITVGASFGDRADVTLQGLSLRNAESHSAGGPGADGVYCVGSAGSTTGLTVLESRIQDNQGVGIISFRCDVTLRRNFIQDNRGGGAWLRIGNFRIVNNLVTGNGDSSTIWPGGLALDRSSALLFVNNTVAFNVPPSNSTPSDVWCLSTHGVLWNSIIWGNGASDEVNGCTLKYSNVQGKPGSNANNSNTISVVPRFDEAFRPHADAMVNAGSNQAPELASIDLAGNPRIQGGQIDMGCYEAQ